MGQRQLSATLLAVVVGIVIVVGAQQLVGTTATQTLVLYFASVLAFAVTERIVRDD